MLDRLLTRLALLTVRRRRLILIFTAVTGIAAFALGGGVVSRLGTSGFEDPASESTKAEQLLLDQFGTGEPDIVLVVRTNDGSSVDSPAAAAAGQALTARLAADPDLADVGSYWTLGAPESLRSDDGSKALVVARTTGGEERRTEIGAAVARDYVGDDGTLTVEASGEASIYAEMSDTITRDLARAETIAIPITLILLVLVFGSLVAAGLPLLLGRARRSSAPSLSLLVLTAGHRRVASSRSTSPRRSASASAIDYALFIVTRYREELARGVEPHEAVVRYGPDRRPHRALLRRSRSPLACRPCWSSRSTSCARSRTPASPSCCSPSLGAVVVLPALLAALGATARQGPRAAHAPTVPPRPDGVSGPASPAASCAGRGPCAIASPRCCSLLGLPFLSVGFGQPDDRVLPSARRAAQAGDDPAHGLRRRASPAPLTVVLPRQRGRRSPTYAADAVARRRRGARRRAAGVYVDGEQVVAASDATARFAAGGGSCLSVVPASSPSRPRASSSSATARGRSRSRADARRRLAAAARRHQGIASPTGCRWPLGDHRALDVRAAVPVHRQPARARSRRWSSTCCRLSATFGAMVWVFQEGHLSGPLDFTATGHARHDDADPHVLHRVRALHGLRGLPALAHQGGVRPHRRQRARRRASACSAPAASSPPPRRCSPSCSSPSPPAA